MRTLIQFLFHKMTARGICHLRTSVHRAAASARGFETLVQTAPILPNRSLLVATLVTLVVQVAPCSRNHAGRYGATLATTGDVASRAGETRAEVAGSSRDSSRYSSKNIEQPIGVPHHAFKRYKQYMRPCERPTCHRQRSIYSYKATD